MPADYNIPMTDAQITEALQLMVERVSEGWAQETYDGSPVGSGSPYYHKSSKYWATRSEDAAARAEAAVPAGTAGAVFFDRAQSLTDAQQEQARQNIKAGGTNPNLVHNPFFRINQRGLSSYTANGYNLDRWTASLGGAGIVSPVADGVKLDNTNGTASINFEQLVDFDEDALIGKVVTVSFMLSNGQIYTGSFTIEQRTASYFNYKVIGFGSSGTYLNAIRMTSSRNCPLLIRFVIAAGQSYTLRAVKLELGSVSTLANDTAPSYAEELAKCQRYFVRLKSATLGGGWWVGIGIAHSTTLADLFITIPVPMRATPTLSKAGGQILIDATSTTRSGDFALLDIINNMVRLRFTATQTLTVGQPYFLNIGGGGYIDLSADL